MAADCKWAPTARVWCGQVGIVQVIAEVPLKVVAALSLALGLALLALFLLSGAGRAAPGWEQLGGLAGGWPLAAGGGVTTALGVALLGRRADGPYAAREVLLVLAVGAAAGCGLALGLGTARRWAAGLLATLAAAGCVETALAVALAARAAAAGTQSKLLLVPGVAGTVVCSVFYLLVFTLGAA